MYFLSFILCIIFGFFHAACENYEDNIKLSELLNSIEDALSSGGASNDLYRQQGFYYPPNNGISLGVYEALQSITKNDELECIPRLLCEAAAGGQPGFSGRQIKFDKQSLTKFISYLNIGSSKYSPLLTFARAALLGVSNRGDPYSCIINYSKCPKDQNRLLYYLNNHQGGFFQYFDKKDRKPGSYYYQNYYRPEYYNQKYENKYKKNKIIFQNENDFINNLKKKATAIGVYAKKYAYSFKFPKSDGNRIYNDDRKYKPMVFPEERNELTEKLKILTNPLVNSYNNRDNEFYQNSNQKGRRNPKTSFFPRKNKSISSSNNAVSDRLTSNFHFPSEENDTSKINSKEKSFFPTS